MKIGILGAAKIAPQALVQPARLIDGVEVFAVAARDRARAVQFASEHGVTRVFNSYAALCESKETDAVYIALPISFHCEWTLRALAGGKAVLCEKAFASNAAEAERMERAAADAGLVLVEAFHWRYHRMAERLIETVRSGRIGAIRTVRAHFNVPFQTTNDIRFDYAMGGGATMDLGCYPIHMLRHVLGEEPEVLSAEAEVGPPDVDVTMRAELRFPSGARGEISCSMRPDAKLAMELVAEGERGHLRAVNPLAPQLGNLLEIETAGGREAGAVKGDPTYLCQLRAFVAAVRDGTPVPTDAADAVRNMRAIDAVYSAAGLRLRGEAPAQA
jgi:predicted dehydrogenase